MSIHCYVKWPVKGRIGQGQRLLWLVPVFSMGKRQLTP